MKNGHSLKAAMEGQTSFPKDSYAEKTDQGFFAGWDTEYRVSTLVSTLLCLWLAGSTAAADPIRKTELVKLGKAATALLEARPGEQPQDPRRRRRDLVVRATAFCVHSSGLFLTSHTAVYFHFENPRLSLVLDSGLKTQRSFKAEVVRADPTLDLVLLRAHGEQPFAALPLKTEEEILELSELNVFSYSGRKVSKPGVDYSPIHVHNATLNTVERESGIPHQLRLSAAHVPVSGGAPAVDHEGQVTGMLIGRQNGTTRMAIPVALLHRFFAKPILELRAPELLFTDRHKPVEFQAVAILLAPSSHPVSLKLKLNVGQPLESVHEMQPLGQTHVVKAAVCPENEEQLILTGRFGDDAIIGLTPDRTFTLDEQEFKLSEVENLMMGPTVRATLRGGKTAEGVACGLEAVNVKVGDETNQVDLTRATAVGIEPPMSIETISYTLEASQQGEIVERLNGTLTIQGVGVSSEPTPAQNGAGVFVPQKRTLKLPAPVSDVAVGGAGRYWVLHLPKVRKLAVLDTHKREITRFLDCSESSILFTAGLDHLIVVLPVEEVMQRWNLHTGEREKTAPIPFKGVVKAIGMGSASQRLMLMHGAVGTEQLDPAFFHFVDTRTLRLMSPEPLPGRLRHTYYQDLFHLRASPRGDAYGMWRSNYSPNELQTIVLSEDQVKVHYERARVEFVVPGSDGKTIFTSRGLHTLEGRPKLGRSMQDESPVLPACQGNYYLRISPLLDEDRTWSSDELPVERRADISVHVLGNSRPLLTLPDIPVVEISPGIRHDFTADKRFLYLPDHKLLAAVPLVGDELTIYHLDLLEALEQAGLDYLFVDSEPPATARKGTSFSYQMSIKSNRNELTYQIKSGPDNMQVSDGRIHWEVPDMPLSPAPVIIRIQDATKQECLHAFTLQITK